jgi:hypothetical protein
MMMMGGGIVEEDFLRDAGDGVESDAVLGYADQHESAAGSDEIESGVHGGLATGAFVDEVYAESCAAFTDQGVGLGTWSHDVCRAQFLGKCPARSAGLEDEDLSGSRDMGKLQGEEADRAGSQDKDTIAQLGGSSAYGMKGDGRGLDHGGIIKRKGIGNAH